LLGLLVFACHRRDEVPKSAYDPEIVETAQKIAENERERDRMARETNQETQQKKGECGRETGGCQEGFLCWDSYFCKNDFPDQCSGSGDRRCHRQCETSQDCPEKMPNCTEVPFFNGSEQGVLQKICIRPK
jgi:hypothetical protein